MNTPFVRTRIADCRSPAVALALGAGQAFGAGFSLQQNSGSGSATPMPAVPPLSEDVRHRSGPTPRRCRGLKTNQIAAAAQRHLSVNQVQQRRRLEECVADPAARR